jgi:hypothetical protein
MTVSLLEPRRRPETCRQGAVGVGALHGRPGFADEARPARNGIIARLATRPRMLMPLVAVPRPSGRPPPCGLRRYE